VTEQVTLTRHIARDAEVVQRAIDWLRGE